MTSEAQESSAESSAMILLVNTTGQQEMLRQYLQKAFSRTADPIKQCLDRLIEAAMNGGELDLATSLWTLVRFRQAELSGDAAGLLVSRLVQLTGFDRELLAETRAVPRSCSACGCTDERACPGGCRWVGVDLCSRCALYPYPRCVVCERTVAHDGESVPAEDALQAGWTADGRCPACDGRRRAS
jgi:hypothetical protein